MSLNEIRRVLSNGDWWKLLDDAPEGSELDELRQAIHDTLDILREYGDIVHCKDCKYSSEISQAHGMFLFCNLRDFHTSEMSHCPEGEFRHLIEGGLGE